MYHDKSNAFLWRRKTCVTNVSKAAATTTAATTTATSSRQCIFLLLCVALFLSWIPSGSVHATNNLNYIIQENNEEGPSSTLLDKIMQSLQNLQRASFPTHSNINQQNEHQNKEHNQQENQQQDKSSGTRAASTHSSLAPPHQKRLGLYQDALHRHYAQLWKTKTTTTNFTQLKTGVEHAYDTYLYGYSNGDNNPNGDNAHEMEDDDTATTRDDVHRASPLLTHRHGHAGAAFPPMPSSRRRANLQLLERMFTQAYDAYIYHAWPKHGEVAPLSCQGRDFSLVPLPGLTLLDSLDTLLIINHNATEFARAVERLRELHLSSSGLFDVDHNVSVFETNIRVLGGLLSAHQMATAWLSSPESQFIVLKQHVFVVDADRPGSRRVRSGRDDENDDDLAPTCAAVPSQNDRSNPCETKSRAQQHQDDEEEEYARHSRTQPIHRSSSPSSSSCDDNGSENECSANSQKDESTKGATTCLPRARQHFNRTLQQQRDKTSQRIYSPDELWTYDGHFLLDLAVDIGERLLPSLNTATGIPYGTVHLQSGVPPGETTVASTAGGGTLVLEFELLSQLSGRSEFGSAAVRAARALWLRQSSLYLMGKHLDVQTGTWTETLSGVGSNSDSFPEYLAKQYFLLNHEGKLDDFWILFCTVYAGIYQELRRGDWYADADMQAGHRVAGRKVLEALMAFYPGLQILLGETAPAARSLNSFFVAREYLGFLPERFLFEAWKVDHGAGAGKHPLRPELLESSYLQHLAFRGMQRLPDSSGWLWASDFALHKLQQLAPAPCGFASLSDVKPLVTGAIGEPTDMRHVNRYDEMPSFFLTETIKYLYLTFDQDNILHQDAWNRNWIFTTEAHPIHYPDIITNNGTSNGSENAENTPEKVQQIVDGLDLLQQLLMQRVQQVKHKVRPPDFRSKHHVALKRRNWTKEFSLKREARSVQGNGHLWSSSTHRTEYIKSLAHVSSYMEASAKSMVNPRSIFQYGGLIQVIQQPDPNRRLPEESFNEAHCKFGSEGLTAGWYLRQACPNFYQSDLVWMHALQGGAMDYVPRFVSTTHDKQRAFLQQQHETFIGATEALAYFGSWKGYPSAPGETVWDLAPVNVSFSSCRVGKSKYSGHLSQRESDLSQQQQGGSGAESEVEQAAGFTEIHTEMGSFKVNAFEGGAGFGVEQMETGQVLTATFVQDYRVASESSTNQIDVDTLAASTYVMVHAHYPRQVVGATNEAAGYQAPPVIENDSLQQEVPADRVVIMADMKGTSFSCDIELVQMHVDSQSEMGIVHQVPCTPAMFGPTHMSNLKENGDLIIEGNMFEPDPQDLHGCQAANDESSISQDWTDIEKNEESCPNHSVQFVHRGECSFIEKSINMQSNQGASGVVVINSDGEEVFIMSYGDQDLEYLDQKLPATVLVSGSDGRNLMELLSILEEVANAEEHYFSIRIALRKQTSEQNDESPNDVETSAIKDDDENKRFPIVRASPSVLRVFSRKNWGIQAVQQFENGSTNWHLQLVRHQLDHEEEDIEGEGTEEVDSESEEEEEDDDGEDEEEGSNDTMNE